MSRNRRRSPRRACADAETKRQPPAPLWARQHARLIQAACGIAPSSAHRVELLASGGATLEALLREVTQARRHIHLEYYIFEPDHTGTRLLQALTERARAGVQVRLLVDAIGSARLLSRHGRALLDELRAAGGELAVFHPRRLDRLRPLVNLRTHRKIVVVDGHAGFVGGINLTDDENEQVRPHDAYRDTHLLIRGGAVRWLQYVFLKDWHYAEGRPPGHDAHLLPEQPPGSLPVQIVASGPDTDMEGLPRAMLDALHLARQREHVGRQPGVDEHRRVDLPGLGMLRALVEDGLKVGQHAHEHRNGRLVHRQRHRIAPLELTRAF